MKESARGASEVNAKSEDQQMDETIFVAAFFTILLALEWRYRLATVRLVTVVVTLVVMVFTDPSPRRAARRAIVAPPPERVTQLRGSPLSDYGSGVVTMERAIVADEEAFADENLLALGVLIWLACSPALRRSPPSGAAASAPTAENPASRS
jgi:hypothetical protein